MSFEALREAIKEGNEYNFYGEDKPKCPHCGETWDGEWCESPLYNEGDQEIECQHCEKEYSVDVVITFHYNTDNQELEEQNK